MAIDGAFKFVKIVFIRVPSKLKGVSQARRSRKKTVEVEMVVTVKLFQQ